MIRHHRGRNFEEEDSILSHGPLRERHCTDVVCCLIFLIVVGGMGVVTHHAYLYGKPERLAYPYDPDRLTITAFE